ISSLACFSVAHVLLSYAVLLKATLPRTSRSFLSSFLTLTNNHQGWDNVDKGNKIVNEVLAIARKGKTIKEEMESKYLKESTTLTLCLPENFSSLYNSHICIMQDGNDYYQLGRVATVSDKLHTNEEIENPVFVGIHYLD